MFKKDLLLSSDHDLAIENFDLKLTTDEQVVGQRVKRALLLFKGEYFLDSELGMPYYSDILGTKNAIDSIRGIFINEIKSVEGVKEVNAFDMVFNDAARTLTIQIKLTDTLNNQIDIIL
jgi:hypothetical protein